jgi:hypothetical protein
MSHFTVMVFGEDPEAQLAPYHEYECTGCDDEYVIDVDYTDEVNEWLEEKVFAGYRKDNGEPDYLWSVEAADESLNDWSVMSRAEYFKFADITGENYDQEVEDWFGAKKKEDGKYYRHTNPNAKWDWYQVGGRWSGFFKLKEGGAGLLGEQSLIAKMGGADPVSPEYADILRKGDIDLEGMMNEVRLAATEEFDHVVEAMGTAVPVSWNSYRDEMKERGWDMDKIREEYRKTEFMRNLSAYLERELEKPREERSENLFNLWGDVAEDYYLHLPTITASRVRYVETRARNAIVPFAFIKDGQWVERGEMGWWAMVTDEKDKDAWTNEFYEMFMSLPDDTIITLVDCHI